jgi:internalin A
MTTKKLYLAVLLLLTLALSGYAGTNPSDRIVVEINRLGGKIEFDETRADRPIVKIDLHSTQVTDSDLSFLNNERKGLKDLRYLDLRLTHIGDAGVHHLRKLTSLQTLNLFRTNLSDIGLGDLRDLRELRVLLIGGTRVTDVGLVHLRRFSYLQKLSLFQTQVTDAGIPNLKVLSSLEQLLISGTKITDLGAKELQKALPKLKFSEQT